MNFVPSTLNGPILFTGLQSIFFNNYLEHTIRWKVEKISDCVEDVKIGFYSTNYLSRNLGPNRCVPMLTNVGPAFFKLKTIPAKGVFQTTFFNDMYVVVDANVSVKLWIEAKRPKSFIDPDLTELFKPYKYIVKTPCGESTIVATEQLIDKQTYQTLLRPTSKYISISQWMINYLSSKAVNITLFGENTSEPSIDIRSLGYIVNESLIVFTFDTRNRYYVMNSKDIKGASNDNKSISCVKGTKKYLNIKLSLQIKMKDAIKNHPPVPIEFYYDTFSGGKYDLRTLFHSDVVAVGKPVGKYILKQVEAESNFSFSVIITNIYSDDLSINYDTLDVFMRDVKISFSDIKDSDDSIMS